MNRSIYLPEVATLKKAKDMTEVDGFFDQPQTQDSGVKLEIFRGRGGNGGDMVNAIDGR
jgi:hypothetical protein